MRPTIDEQLDGAQRLLRIVEGDEGLSAASREVLVNAVRLLRRVRGSWASVPSFLVDDNAELAALLRGLDDVVPGLVQVDPGLDPDLDVAAAAERNTAQRELLACAIRELPRTAEGLAARERIGDYLRARVQIEP
jgi:muconolactone delta-isomerase